MAPIDAAAGGPRARGGPLPCQACLGVADFNSDGKPDIVFSGGVGTPYAGVLLGNGDGTFRPGIVFPYPGPSTASPLTVGDFNGDGKPDVAFLGAPTSVFLGKGDGTFSAPSFTTVCDKYAFGYLFTSVDIDHDGRQDLVCGWVIAQSNGDGYFRSSISLGNPPQLLADFDHDGNIDVVIQSAGQFDLIHGLGDGRFTRDILITTPLKANTLLAGDFNGDGFPDIAALSSDGNILILPGRGDGSFGAAVVTANTPGDLTGVGDFNHDGKLDLISGYAVLAGNGDGTFRFPVFLGVATEACRPDFQTAGGNGCPFTPDATAVADFNGDGLPDIAVAYYLHGYTGFTSHSISALLNDTHAGGFTITGVSAATGTWPVGPSSLVSAFGTNLAPRTEAAGSNPAPTELGGIRLHVRDRSHTGDMLAPLLYVSPTQINYLMNSSDPFAWVDIERIGSSWTPHGLAVPIASLAPGLFFIGPNLAAANALKASGSGFTVTPVSACLAPICSSAPVNVTGPDTYLSLYGTGLAGASTTDSSCFVGSSILPVAYAGPQKQIAGLDQINMLLPAGLAGTGDTSIFCAIGLPDKTTAIRTNSVKLNIR